MKTITVDRIYLHGNSIVAVKKDKTGTIIYDPKISKVISHDVTYEAGSGDLCLVLKDSTKENRIKAREGE